jgi:hypothetical protein
MSEKRTVPRHRVLKAGKIEFGGGSTIDCTIRNVSRAGAALDVETPMGIPERFTLFISSDKLRFACVVVYRKGGRIGVAFV